MARRHAPYDDRVSDVELRDTSTVTNSGFERTVSTTASTRTPERTHTSVMLSAFQAAHVFHRSPWTTRYMDPEVENDYLAFCHASPYPRLSLLVLFVPSRVTTNIIGFVLGSIRNPPVYNEVYTTLYIVAMLLIPFTFPAVTRRLSIREQSRNTLCEYIIIFVALTARLSDMSVGRVPLNVVLPNDTIFATNLLNEKAGPLLWYLTIVPPRLFTGLPACVLVAIMFAVFTVPKHVHGASDWCAVFVVPFELMVTIGLLWIWEKDRRANFEVRSALTFQNQRGRELVTTLRRELHLCGAEGSPLIQTNGESTTPSKYHGGDHNIVYSDAAIIAIRIVTSKKSDVLSIKKTLAVVAEAVAGAMHQYRVVRFASAHDIMCLAVVRHDDAVLNSSLESPPALAACIFARALHRQFSSMTAGDGDDDAPLRIAVARGPTNMSSLPTVELRAMSALIRLCDLALPGSTLIGDEVRGLVAGTFTTTLLHETVLDGRRAALHLLGMPWSDAGLLWEAKLHAELRGPDREQEPSDSFSRELLLTALPTSSASVGGAFEDLADEAQAESTVEFRWSWLFGWYFVDAEVEDEFRSHECRGPARLFPAAVTVGVCFVVMGWYLSSGLEALKPLCWMTWGAATVLAFATIPVARPPHVGKLRLCLLSALQHAVILLLSVSLHYVIDYRNPVKIYMVAIWSFSAICGLVWIPSVFPIVFVLLFGTECLYLASPTLTSVNGQMYYVTILSIFMTILACQTIRYRNRWLFADSLAAQRSRDTWLAARDQLERAFQRIVPAEVARRVVAAGTKSIVDSHLSATGQTMCVSGALDWLRFGLQSDAALVLAVEIDIANDHEGCHDVAAAFDAAIALGSSRLTLCCADHDGMLWCTAGMTWLLVALRDYDGSSLRLLRDAAKDVEDAMGSIGYAVVTGIGRGRLSGDLIGHRSRRYEVCGEAVANALASMAESTAHLTVLRSRKLVNKKPLAERRNSATYAET
jgi:hypothetical protein